MRSWELRASRARLVTAADEERRRIARDLHDGLQARLVLLAIQAHGIGADLSAPAGVRSDAAEIEAGLVAAIADLRALVNGVMPAALTERGLYAATEELADRMPIPTELHFVQARGALPKRVESTGYFVVAEALANAVKHARARELAVRLEHTGERLRIEVRDDGVGGAQAGGGIQGMADRIAALDGRLDVESPPGRGTRVLAEVPCAS